MRGGLVVAAAAGLAAGGLGAVSALVPADAPSAGVAAAPLRWTGINHPIALYDLGGTDFSKLHATYRARRRSPDGAREDVMTFGAVSDATPFLLVSLLRAGNGLGVAAAGDGLADGLVRLAATQRLRATRIRAAVPVDTRLGRVEAADLLLWDGAVATPCLGFRGAGNGDGVLRLAGFACGTRDRPMGRAALACAVDRIDLVSAGDDTALRTVFVAAERRGGSSCLGAAPASAGPLVATGRRIGWLDPAGALPPLRGLVEPGHHQRRGGNRDGAGN